MRRGVRFEIPTEKYNEQSLADILKPIPCELYTWQIGDEEVHVEGEAGSYNSLFGDNEILDGIELRRLVSGEKYLAIFAELKAFPNNEVVSEVATYNDFVSSKCEIIVLMIDCYYIDFYCKDPKLIDEIYIYAKQSGYADIEYIDEYDPRTRMYCW